MKSTMTLQDHCDEVKSTMTLQDHYDEVKPIMTLQDHCDEVKSSENNFMITCFQQKKSVGMFAICPHGGRTRRVYHHYL